MLTKPQTFWLLKRHSLAFSHVTKLDLSKRPPRSGFAPVEGECREFLEATNPCIGVVSLKLQFYPCSDFLPPLPEMLECLAPLASSLEELDLSANKLGGSVTPKISLFDKLKVLKLDRTGLEGACDCTSNPY